MAEAIKKLNKRIGNIKGKITKFMNWLGDDKSVATEEIEIRYEQAEKSLQEYYEAMEQLEIIDESTDYEADKKEFEGNYFKCLAVAKGILKKRVNTVQNTFSFTGGEEKSSDNFNIKLPTINLPSFDGEYAQWYPFKDTFGALIHNSTTIPDIQKFYYLNSCLKGKARELLASLEVSSNNYMLGWELLKERFENPKLIKMRM